MRNQNNKSQFLSKLRNAVGFRDAVPNFDDSVLPINSLNEALLSDPPQYQVNSDGIYSISRTPEQQEALFHMLKRAAEPLRLDAAVHDCFESAAEAIKKIVEDHEPEWGSEKILICADHPTIRRLNLPVLFQNSEVQVYQTDETAEKNRLKQALCTASAGVTSADFCVAETGTLAIITRSGQPRSLSLLPSIHIAVIYENQMVQNIKELYYFLSKIGSAAYQEIRRFPNMVLITGPSKTADIEAVMVHGAHGPRKVSIQIIKNGLQK